IERLHLTRDGRADRFGVGMRANENGAKVIGELLDREVHIVRWRSIEACRADVSHDTDDGRKKTCFVENVANGILSRPQPFGHALADHDHPWAAQSIARLEQPSSQERDPKSSEEVGADIAHYRADPDRPSVDLELSRLFFPRHREYFVQP